MPWGHGVLFRILIISFGLIFSISTGWARADSWREFGDAGRIAAPAYALLMAAFHGDLQGGIQFGASLLFSQGVVEGLKHVTDKKRPDWKPGDKEYSFPSGHAAGAWAGAAFVQRRYGCYEFRFNCFMLSLPVYGVAAATAYSRVHANRHNWVDIAASVIIAETINILMVSPYNRNVTIVPTFKNGFGIAIFGKF